MASNENQAAYYDQNYAYDFELYLAVGVKFCNFSAYGQIAT